MELTKRVDKSGLASHADADMHRELHLPKLGFIWRKGDKVWLGGSPSFEYEESK